MTDARPRTVVIGLGNPDRGDDAAGRTAARRLQGTLPAGIEIAEHDGEPASLLALIDGAERVILIDACVSGTASGTVQRFDAASAPLPEASYNVSTHGLGLAEAIELARALGQLPATCLVYAVEGEAFEAGAPLSPAVRNALDDVCARVRAEITAFHEVEVPQDA